MGIGTGGTATGGGGAAARTTTRWESVLVRIAGGHSDTRDSTDEPEDRMPSEVSQSQKDKYRAIPLLRGPWRSQIRRNRERNGGCRLVLTGTGAVGGDENVAGAW